MMLTKHKKSTSFGFTLVELIVAMSVFMIAFSLIVGAFVRILKTQRIITHLMSVHSNTSLVLEQMIREMRGGFDFSLTNNGVACAQPFFDTLTFTRARGSANVAVTYAWNTNTKTIDRKEDLVGGAGSFSALTAPNVSVERLCFLLKQNTSQDPWRVSVFITAAGSNADLVSNVINLESTVSARILPGELAP